jgi:hypothetical protein
VQSKLLRAWWETAVATEDDIDDVSGVLKTLRPQLVSLVVLLLLPLAILVGKRRVEGLAKGDALEKRVLGHRALLVQDLLILVLLVLQLFAAWVAINSHDFIIWLALLGGSRVVLLDFVGAVVAVALVVVILGEELILLVGLSLHHVVELHDSLGAVASDVAVDIL